MGGCLCTVLNMVVFDLQSYEEIESVELVQRKLCSSEVHIDHGYQILCVCVCVCGWVGVLHLHTYTGLRANRDKIRIQGT